MDLLYIMLSSSKFIINELIFYVYTIIDYAFNESSYISNKMFFGHVPLHFIKLSKLLNYRLFVY